MTVNATVARWARRIGLNLNEANNQPASEGEANYEARWAQLQPQLRELEKVDPEAGLLIREAGQMRVRAEAYLFDQDSLTDLDGLAERIELRINNVTADRRAYEAAETNARTVREELPRELAVPEKESLAKRAKAYNTRIKEANKAFVLAASTASNGDFVRAAADMGDVLATYTALRDEIQDLKQAHDARVAAVADMPEYKACQEAMKNIRENRANLAKAHGVDERVLAKLDTCASVPEKEFQGLEKYFRKEMLWRSGESLKNLVKTHEALFKSKRKKLEDLAAEYESLRNAAGANLPPLLDADVSVATEAADKDDERAERERLRADWKRLHAEAAAKLRQLTAFGSDATVQMAHDQLKGKYDQLSGLAAEAEPSVEQLKAGIGALKKLSEDVQAKIDEFDGQSTTYRAQLLARYKALGDRLKQLKRPGVRKSDKAELFEQLNQERKALKPLLQEASHNFQALQHVSAQLKRLEDAATSYTAGNDGLAQYEALKETLAELKKQIDAPPLAALKATQKGLLSEFTAVEKEYKKYGSSQPSVATSLKALKTKVKDAQDNAGDVLSQRGVLQADFEFTAAMLDEALPNLEQSARLAVEPFDANALRKRLDTIRQSADGSESAADYDAALNQLRTFRAELRGFQNNTSEDIFKTSKQCALDEAARQQEEGAKEQAKQQFEADYQHFKDGDYRNARDLLEKPSARRAAKVFRTKRDQRAKTLKGLHKQLEAMVKLEGCDYDAAQAQLDMAKRYARDILDNPEGKNKTPEKGDFNKLGQQWRAAVTALHGSLNKLIGDIGKAGDEIAPVEGAPANFKKTADDAKEAFEDLKKSFHLDAFDKPLEKLADAEADAQKGVKEQVLQLVRLHRRHLRDPLFAKLPKNPFTAVKILDMVEVLGNIDEVVQQA